MQEHSPPSGTLTHRLSLFPGTLTLILGPNGAGKTVFIEKLAGLREPEGLSICYEEQPLWIRKKFGNGQRLNPRALLSFSFASQAPEDGLFLRSIGKELDFSLRPYAKQLDADSMKKSIHQALDAVSWDNKWLGRDPRLMSGGERRRAALAALFVTPAPWLLLDEPTAGLDREGQERLAQHLAMLKREGRGIVLISHETDWALPLADQVLLFYPDRGVRLFDPEQLIKYPELLEQAGMMAPAWLKIIRAATYGTDWNFDWRHPAQAAFYLEQIRKKPMHYRFPEQKNFLNETGSKNSAAPSHTAGDKDAKSENNIAPISAFAASKAELETPISADAAPKIEHETPKAGMDSPPGNKQRLPAEHPLARFDPRSVWLGYILLSVGIFTLSTWTGLLAGAITVLALIAFGRIPLFRWRGLLAGFVIFGAGFAGLNAVRFASPDGGAGIMWETPMFLQSMFPFARTMIVLLLGLGLPLIWTPLSVRKALEQMAARKGKIPAFWQRNVLIITLTLRFIPVLLQEWERFGRIYLARGKETRKTPAAILRKLRGSFLPLLLSLIRLAEEAAAALESRGVRRGAKLMNDSRLRWNYRDYMIVAAALSLAVFFILFD